MISVIIATLNSERALLRTLAPLVPGALDGLVSEVIVADGGSSDDTAAVADIAGCNFVRTAASTGARLKDAAARARAPWLLFVQPGTMLEPTWVADARHFIEQSSPTPRAAAFTYGRASRAGASVLWRMAASALGALPDARQGLLISRAFYDALGGHGDRADAEADLIRRVGRRRMTRLPARAVAAADT